MKLFNFNPQTEASPAFKKILLALFIIAVLIGIVAGCGDDNPVNNGGNGNATTDSLLYSIDSLGLTLDTGSIGNIDTTFNIGANADSIKINMTLSTNCQNDSAATQPNIRAMIVNVDDTLINETSLMNQTHNVYLKGSTNLSLNFIIGLSNLTNSLKYFKVKNIKIYKLNLH